MMRHYQLDPNFRPQYKNHTAESEKVPDPRKIEEYLALVRDMPAGYDDQLLLERTYAAIENWCKKIKKQILMDTSTPERQVIEIGAALLNFWGWYLERLGFVEDDIRAQISRADKCLNVAVESHEYFRGYKDAMQVMSLHFIEDRTRQAIVYRHSIEQKRITFESIADLERHEGILRRKFSLEGD
jgi:hypothetical protein